MAVLAKAPVAGEVKTRLTPILHAREAADLARALLLDTIAQVEAAGLELVVAFTPSAGRRALERLLGTRRRLVPQGGGSLGERLERVIAGLASAAGRKRAVLAVGTDCPALTAERLAEAERALDSADVVLGPAADGGFYLIGLRRHNPRLFEDVPWSTAGTMRAVEERARSEDLRVARLPVERDLDVPEDLYEWYAGSRAAALREAYPQTSAILHTILPPRRQARLEATLRGEPEG